MARAVYAESLGTQSVSAGDRIVISLVARRLERYYRMGMPRNLRDCAFDHDGVVSIVFALYSFFRSRYGQVDVVHDAKSLRLAMMLPDDHRCRCRRAYVPYYGRADMAS